MMYLTSNRRFIEESFPTKEVSFHSGKEKSIRHGHISTLHIWWARRPLASSRSTQYAALIPAADSIEEAATKIDFITELSKWKSSLNNRLIGIARRDILKAYGNRPPKVLDPFAGGGSIPLEALRLGCETYSSDLNPVSVLIQKCTLEFPMKYAGKHKQEDLTSNARHSNPLYEDVSRWSHWILKKANAEIGSFFPDGPGTHSTIGYLWARTIPCQNPLCGIEIPLMRHFWLSRKENRKIALYPEVKSGTVTFQIVGDGYDEFPTDFNPSRGSVKGAVVVCPACHTSIDGNTTRKLFRDKQSGERMIAIILRDTQRVGKFYRIATMADMKSYSAAKEQLAALEKKLNAEWGIAPVPDEAIHTPDSREYVYGNPYFRDTAMLVYGVRKWADLFNSRQLLANVMFTKFVRDAYNEMVINNYEKDYAIAVSTYLALILDRLVDKNATLCPYNAGRETTEHVFGKQALSIVWDYVELNPFTHVGWLNMTNWVLRNIEHLGLIDTKPATVLQTSATSLPFPDCYFDAVFTDPPYYDNIAYSLISDFFYVWLKRSIGHHYPELFSTPLAPKSNEIIAEIPMIRGIGKKKAAKSIKGVKAKEDFESMLLAAFKEIHRVLKHEAIALIVYAHKSTDGWESLLNSLLDSGLVISGAWPLHTERSGRLTARGTASLASSIYIVARKTTRESTGFYREVKRDLKDHLHKRLEHLWTEGISGADFFVAAIGSAIEVFGKYDQVMDYEQNIIRASRLLDDVREISTDFAVRQILHDGFAGDISDLTRFYVLYRWNYQDAKVHFDEARKLAQSCGIELEEHWGGSGFIRKEKEFIRVLGPHERKLEHLKEATAMIDIIHGVLLLWEKNRRDEISEILVKSGLSQREVFWRVAQAISETLSIQNKEKKLLDGFLAGRNGYVDQEQHEQVTVQGKPVKTRGKKKRKGRSPQMNREDEHEQVKLE